MRTVGPLAHGGIMANYRCTAACRHCMYASSPQRTGGYITLDTAQQISKQLRKAGCYSIHIGGGEPFLNFEGLLDLVALLTSDGIVVEYIETNASWATDHQMIRTRLQALSAAGADSLCISVDPFHIEYVPLERPLELAKICQQERFGYFLWQERFLPLFSEVDPTVPQCRKTLEELLAPDYLWQVSESYGISYRGRALNIEQEYCSPQPLAAVATATPCTGLLSSRHFHIDKDGRYIPSSCTGIYLPLEEVLEGIPKGKYPIFDTLLQQGIAGLLTFAKAQGFVPDSKGYTSRCSLCFHLRHWLSKNGNFLELDDNFYPQSLAYYK